MSFNRNERSPLAVLSFVNNTRSPSFVNTMRLEKIDEKINEAEKTIKSLAHEKMIAEILQHELAQHDNVLSHVKFTLEKISKDFLVKYNLSVLIDQISHPAPDNNMTTDNKSKLTIKQIDESVAKDYREMIKGLTNTIDQKVEKAHHDLRTWQNQKNQFTPQNYFPIRHKL